MQYDKLFWTWYWYNRNASVVYFFSSDASICSCVIRMGGTSRSLWSSFSCLLYWHFSTVSKEPTNSYSGKSFHLCLDKSVHSFTSLSALHSHEEVISRIYKTPFFSLFGTLFLATCCPECYYLCYPSVLQIHVLSPKNLGC